MLSHGNELCFSILNGFHKEHSSFLGNQKVDSRRNVSCVIRPCVVFDIGIWARMYLDQLRWSMKRGKCFISKNRFIDIAQIWTKSKIVNKIPLLVNLSQWLKAGTLSFGRFCGPNESRLNKFYMISWFCTKLAFCKRTRKLDPVDSTVRYEVMKLCTGALRDNNSLYVVVLSQ